MTEKEITDANATVRKQMHSAASAVLNAMIRNLHLKTGTRVLLTDPPISSHIVNYTVLAGDPTDVVAWGETFGLKNVTQDVLEVKSS